MAILCCGSFITDFPDAWHTADCCRVDIEQDAALLNSTVWLVSLFPCRGRMMLRLCGGGWPELAVEWLMMLCWTDSNNPS